jgi:uncharacterized membrane protein YdjX (TVP38/TMEM64 family)
MEKIQTVAAIARHNKHTIAGAMAVIAVFLILFVAFPPGTPLMH